MFLSPGHVVPRIAGGKVFIVAPDRAVTCLDLATGRQLWRDNSRKARETTGLGGDGRQFYYKTMDGELAAVDTSADAYRETWCTDLGWGYEYNSCPACVRDGVVYVAGRLGQVAAVREDGTLLWSVKCCNSAGNDFRQAPDGSLWGYLRRRQALPDSLTALGDERLPDRIPAIATTRPQGIRPKPRFESHKSVRHELRRAAAPTSVLQAIKDIIQQENASG